ncbi:hypothetical protein NKG05_24920 [Oerskovia sp. M15]
MPDDAAPPRRARRPEGRRHAAAAAAAEAKPPRPRPHSRPRRRRPLPLPLLRRPPWPAARG